TCRSRARDRLPARLRGGCGPPGPARLPRQSPPGRRAPCPGCPRTFAATAEPGHPCAVQCRRYECSPAAGVPAMPPIPSWLFSPSAQAADGAVYLQELLFGQIAGALPDIARPWIGAAHLLLFFLREREHAQGKHFVNFGGIKKVAGALRRDLRIVVQNDGRNQDRVASAGFTGQYREYTRVAAGGNAFLKFFGRFKQRNQLSR